MENNQYAYAGYWPSPNDDFQLYDNRTEPDHLDDGADPLAGFGDPPNELFDIPTDDVPALHPLLNPPLAEEDKGLAIWRMNTGRATGLPAFDGTEYGLDNSHGFGRRHPVDSRSLPEYGRGWNHGYEPVNAAYEHQSLREDALAVAEELFSQNGASTIVSGEDVEQPKEDSIKTRKRDAKAAMLHTCQRCKSSFSSKGDMTKHARTHGPKRKECTQCSQKFVFPKDLKRHELTHKAPGFQCRNCQRAFTRLDHCQRHMDNGVCLKSHRTPSSGSYAASESAMGTYNRPLAPRTIGVPPPDLLPAGSVSKKTASTSGPHTPNSTLGKVHESSPWPFAPTPYSSNQQRALYLQPTPPALVLDPQLGNLEEDKANSFNGAAYDLSTSQSGGILPYRSQQPQQSLDYGMDGTTLFGEAHDSLRYLDLPETPTDGQKKRRQY